MSRNQLWQRLWQKRKAPRRHHTAGTRLKVEHLEERRLLAVIAPAGFADGLFPFFPYATHASSFSVPTLRDAVVEANYLSAHKISASNTIQLKVGDYVLAGGPTPDGTAGELLVSSNLTIKGAGAALTTITGSGADRVIEIGTKLNAAGNPVVTPVTASLQNLAITGGVAVDNGLTAACVGDAYGGGILDFGGSLSLSKVALAGNVASGTAANAGGGGAAYGGGLAVLGPATVSLSGVTVSLNAARGAAAFNAEGGGIYMLGPGSLTIKASTISGNFAVGGAGTAAAAPGIALGGGLYSNGPKVAISGSSIGVTGEGNAAFGGGGVTGTAGANGGAGGFGANAGGGGAYIAGAAPVSITGSVLIDNDAVGGGGGNGGSATANLGVGGAGGTGGSAAGGGLYLKAAPLTLSGTVFQFNKAIGGAGGTGGAASLTGGAAALKSGVGGAGGAGGTGLGGGLFLNGTTTSITGGALMNNLAGGGNGGTGGGAAVPAVDKGTGGAGGIGGDAGGGGADIISGATTIAKSPIQNNEVLAGFVGLGGAGTTAGANAPALAVPTNANGGAILHVFGAPVTLQSGERLLILNNSAAVNGIAGSTVDNELALGAFPFTPF
jgi:hypothetical protein